MYWNELDYDFLKLNFKTGKCKSYFDQYRYSLFRSAFSILDCEQSLIFFARRQEEGKKIYFTQLGLQVIQTDKEKETNKYNYISEE